MIAGPGSPGMSGSPGSRRDPGRSAARGNFVMASRRARTQAHHAKFRVASAHVACCRAFDRSAEGERIDASLSTELPYPVRACGGAAPLLAARTFPAHAQLGAIGGPAGPAIEGLPPQSGRPSPLEERGRAENALIAGDWLLYPTAFAGAIFDTNPSQSRGAPQASAGARLVPVAAGGTDGRDQPDQPVRDDRRPPVCDRRNAGRQCRRGAAWRDRGLRAGRKLGPAWAGRLHAPARPFHHAGRHP